MKRPDYILGAAPCEPTRLKNIFEAGEGSIMEMLRNPKPLRARGWDIRTYKTPEIVKGEFLEVGNKESRLIRLYEDGTLLLSAAAHNHFLCWAQDTEEFLKRPRLNPLPLIELTYNFVCFYSKLIPFFKEKPEMIRFNVELINTFLEKSKLHLAPYQVGSFGWSMPGNWKEAPENEMKKELDIPTDKLEENPGHVTYQLIEKLYRWFGFSVDVIPYTAKDGEGERYVDRQKIIELG